MLMGEPQEGIKQEYSCHLAAGVQNHTGSGAGNTIWSSGLGAMYSLIVHEFVFSQLVKMQILWAVNSTVQLWAPSFS